MPNKRREHFIYTSGWSAAMAAAGASQSMTINIAADADFEFIYLTAAVEQGGVLVTNWAGTLQLQYSAEGKEMSNSAFPLSAVFGSGSEPYILQPPKVVPRNSSIVVVVTSPVATNTQVEVSLHGNKLY